MLTNDEELIHALYWRIKRKPEEGTLEPAIRTHAQACGMIAFLFNLHPDHVAEIVAAQPPPGTAWASAGKHSAKRS